MRKNPFFFILLYLFIICCNRNPDKKMKIHTNNDNDIEEKSKRIDKEQYTTYSFEILNKDFIHKEILMDYMLDNSKESLMDCRVDNPKGSMDYIIDNHIKEIINKISEEENENGREIENFCQLRKKDIKVIEDNLDNIYFSLLDTVVSFGKEEINKKLKEELASLSFKDTEIKGFIKNIFKKGKNSIETYKKLEKFHLHYLLEDPLLKREIFHLIFIKKFSRLYEILLNEKCYYKDLITSDLIKLKGVFEGEIVFYKGIPLRLIKYEKN